MDESEVARWARAERARVALDTVAARLRPHGIRLAAFKGISIVFGKFGDPARRHLTDADAVVMEGSPVEAIWRAHQCGWPVRFDDPTAVMLWVNGSKVDLHTRVLPHLVGKVGRDALHDSLRVASWAASEVLEFDDATQAVLLLAHLAKDRFAAVSVRKCSADLRILEKRGVAEEAILQRAGALELRRATLAALVACGRPPIGTANPAEVARAEEDIVSLQTSSRRIAAIKHRMLADTRMRALGAVAFAGVSRPVARLLRHWV